jgi:hypothetical protein
VPERLSLVKLTIPGQPNQFVTAANIGGIDYGIESISTDENGLLYLWLPASIDGKLITVTINDIDYGVTYQRPYNGGGVEQTMESAVTSISIENEPIKLTYIEGEALDLTGLKVILNRSDNSSEEVAFHEFISNGIVTTPANGEAVSVSGSAVTITCTLYNKSVSQPIMVIPLDATISPTSISYDLNASDDISTAITWNANSTITDVVYGSVSLPTEAYAVSGNALTIKSSYINGLGVSEGDVLPFIISFDMGKPVTLNVNIVNSYTPSSNALLSHLTVNGNPINEFDPNITEYQMTLPSGTRSVLVGAVSEDPHATVTITKPQSLPGDAIVSVTAEDGITTKNYTIHLTIFQSNVSSGGAGGSTETTSNTPSKETKSIFKSNLPTIGKAYIKAKKGADNSATAVISKKIVANTMAKAQTESVKQGKAEDGISILLSISRPAGTDSLSVVLSQDILTQLTTIEVSTLEIECDLYRLCLDLEAIKEIQKQSTGDITIHIEPVTGLTGDAKTMIGKRPVYNITISYVKKGKTVHITSLGKGNATLSIPYTPGKKENVSHLFGVYVDNSGKATRIESSAYDTNSGSIMFDSNHFSVYGVGYSTPKEKYTDISTHWAKESIDYVAGRGLIDGTTTTTFSPNMAISRGTLVTALGRMAGVDVSKYKTDLFTDVEADQYYAPYMEWAYKNSIISEVSSGKGAPDQAVTLEEVALILSNYAKATGYTLPVIREAISFADADLTGSTYKEAVTSMQQAGIVMSRSDSRFSPRSNATRGEVAAMLHRYIKLSIDPATAQGWVVNDAGQRLYYKDGIMVSNSWLEINEKWYYFKTDGSLAVSTKVDGYEVDENGVRRTKENE